MIALRLATVAAGAIMLVWILASAIRTVVIPRPERVWLTRVTFSVARVAANMAAGLSSDPVQRDRWLGMFGPVALLMLPVLWSLGAMVAYALVYWGIDGGSLLYALELSGSSLTTLGFVGADTTLLRMIAVSQGLLGLGLVALMISFTPSLYGTFSRREVAVGRFTVRAGEPPRPAEFILRLDAIGQLQDVGRRWADWEDWFVELGETHTSFPSLVYFRSMSPDRSWLSAAEASLDTAAIISATGMVADGGQADTMIRAGYLALRSIADFFDVEPELDPADRDQISVTRASFDAVLDKLEAGGCDLPNERDDAWQSFMGWRVNYDRSVLGLAQMVGQVDSHWKALPGTDGSAS
jgi:hypothetical protein